MRALPFMKRDDEVSDEILFRQVLAFQKSWRSFSPITECIPAQCQCWTQGAGGGGAEEAVSVLKKFFFHALYVQ